VGSPRRSYAGIGKAVRLSEGAVRQRVQRMVDAGVMQIVAVTDPMQQGFARQAMIGIKCSGDATKVAEKPSTIDPSTTWCSPPSRSTPLSRCSVKTTETSSIYSTRKSAPYRE
jgi:DNA-binding Lrp family transcriptional regulator